MRRDHGFTLIEILVVVGIISLIIGVLVPVIGRARDSSKRASCMNNVRQIGQALLGYASENKGEFPRIRSFPGALGPVYVSPPPDAPNPFAANYYNDSSAALFLLLRQDRIRAQALICPATDDVVEDFGGADPATRSNFSITVSYGGDPKTRSYTYARLYPTAEAAASGFTHKPQYMNPDFAILADYGIPICALDQEPAQWYDAGRRGNSLNHKQAGQNVLYPDGRVEWHITNRCGTVMPRHPTEPDHPNYVGRDNIYKGYDRNYCSPELAKNKSDSVLEEGY